MSHWVHPDLSEAASPLVEESLQGAVPPSAVEVVARILRRVLRIDLPAEPPLYCKQHLFPFLRLRLRYLLRPSPTQKERRLLEGCQRRGIQCPAPLAESTQRGLLGPRLAVLVTRALPEGRAPTPIEHLKAVEDLARKGLYHPDLHGDNLRILEDGQLATLDLQSCRLTTGPVGSSGTRRMMAKAALSLWDSQGLSHVESLLLDETWAVPGPRILAEMRVLAARRQSSRRRHYLRSSTRVEAKRLSPIRKRLILRGRTLPSGFSDPVRSHIPGLGPCLISTAPTDVWRVCCARGLLGIWLASLFDEAPLRGKAEVFAWEGAIHAPLGIPFSPEVLYISGCENQARLGSLISTLLSTQHHER